MVLCRICVSLRKVWGELGGWSSFAGFVVLEKFNYKAAAQSGPWVGCIHQRVLHKNASNQGSHQDTATVSHKE
jgi:hypothetical protein